MNNLNLLTAKQIELYKYVARRIEDFASYNNNNNNSAIDTCI